MIVRSAQAVHTRQFEFLIATMTCAQIVAAMSLSVVFPPFDVFDLWLVIMYKLSGSRVRPLCLMK